MLKVVGFSGPPRSGKDTLGNLLAAYIRSRDVYTETQALSTPMRHAVYAMLGLTYTRQHYEANKDKPFTIPGGRGETTIRAEMISLSEHHVKQRLGEGWWANALLNRIEIQAGVLVITDMGFHAEVEVFEDKFGPENCCWVQVHREGCTFAHDSRKFVGKDRATVIYNDDAPSTGANRVLGRLLNQFGWML